jgi:hypothetical protein
VDCCDKCCERGCECWVVCWLGEGGERASDSLEV